MANAWTEALAAYERVTDISNAIDVDKHEAAFDAAADMQNVEIEKLLNTPAPNLAAVATKLQIVHRDGYQHMLAPLIADIERLDKGGTMTRALWGAWQGTSYVLPRSFPGVSEEMSRTYEHVRTAYFARDEGAGTALHAASKSVAAVKTQSGPDLSAKIILALFESGPSHAGSELAVERSDLPTENVAEILLSAAADAAAMRPVNEDPKIVEAFEAYRTAFGEFRSAAQDAEDEPFFRRMDPADMILKTTPALTPAGVAMKLKRAFQSLVGEQWSDDAVFDDRPAEFLKHVRKSDPYQEMFWRAIEDLDRMTAEGR